jgi:hypothetical protein
MEFELHAPSMLVVVVSLILAVLALICYFVITPATMGIACDVSTRTSFVSSPAPAASWPRTIASMRD